MKDHYHHGNLKKDLLEKSIHIISEKGFDKLSLRNISSKCGVSHNAIYRHFADKNQLIYECQKYVTEEFTLYLKSKEAEKKRNALENIRTLSYAYINFYIEHPTYYSFMYRNTYIKIEFTMEKKEENYPPYNVFREQYRRLAEEIGISFEESLTRLTRLWALLHGLTAFLISDNVQWNNEWQSCLEKEFN